jgi:ABC-type nickel/cobalt efflux system permease component RcnA
MKQFIMIIFIALHLISSTLYATTSFSNQHNVDFNTHKCSFHEHSHEHHHTHNSSTHQHKHSHTQTHINLLDFFVHVDNNQFIHFNSTQKYLETRYFISNPQLESIFRPPIV